MRDDVTKMMLHFLLYVFSILILEFVIIYIILLK